jgi:hypothetical protein
MSRPFPFIQAVRNDLRISHYALKADIPIFIGFDTSFASIKSKSAVSLEMMGNAEIENFLHYLVNTQRVSAANPGAERAYFLCIAIS